MTMTFEHWSRVIDQLATVKGETVSGSPVHKKSIFIIFVSAAQPQIQISPSRIQS